MDIGDVVGIGPGTERVLRSLGIETAEALLEQGAEGLMGKTGYARLVVERWLGLARLSLGPPAVVPEAVAVEAQTEPTPPEVAEARPEPSPWITVTFVRMRGRPDVGAVEHRGRLYPRGQARQVRTEDVADLLATAAYEFQVTR